MFRTPMFIKGCSGRYGRANNSIASKEVCLDCIACFVFCPDTFRAHSTNCLYFILSGSYILTLNHQINVLKNSPSAIIAIACPYGMLVTGMSL
jgi:Fe-S-cluster-containing hydrogenase component 2